MSKYLKIEVRCEALFCNIYEPETGDYGGKYAITAIVNDKEEQAALRQAISDLKAQNAPEAMGLRYPVKRNPADHDKNPGAVLFVARNKKKPDADAGIQMGTNVLLDVTLGYYDVENKGEARNRGITAYLSSVTNLDSSREVAAVESEDIPF